MAPFSVGEKGSFQWTSTARGLLNEAPNRVEVLQRFMQKFDRPGWPEKPDRIIEAYVTLLDEIDGDSALTEFINRQKERLAKQITSQQSAESFHFTKDGTEPGFE